MNSVSALQVRSQRLFASHGRRCAQHPTAALLIICIGSCLLLYPALDLYFWTAGTRRFHHHTPNPTTFWTTWGLREREASDLTLPWEGFDEWDACEDAKCWERCPSVSPSLHHDAVRIRRALVTSREVDLAREGTFLDIEHGALERRTLQQSLRLQQALSRTLQSTCDRHPVCEIPPLSPFTLWDHSEAKLLGDAALERTIDAALAHHERDSNISPLFAGRRVQHRQVHGAPQRHLHRADFLALSYFLPANDDGVDPWTSALQTSTLNGTAIMFSPGTPRKVLLRRTSTASTSSSPVMISAFTYDTELFLLANFIVGMYVYLTLRKLDQVHNRPGLVLTGLIEIAMSGLLSLSVCGLFGLEFDLVPWKLLPFVVAVLGVDNMLLLGDAVVLTSIDLSVPDRIAAGLGSVGFSITISLLAEISAILCVHAIVSPATRVIRELCIFSIVALIVEYCLELTFFLTVLSIDLQRLELADLIRQGSKVPTRAKSIQRKHHSKLSNSTSPSVVKTTLKSVQRAVVAGIRARMARVVTFNVLFGIFFTLWLTRAPERFVPEFCADLANGRPQPSPMYQSESVANQFWNSINPTGQPIMALIVEPLTFVSLPPAFPIAEPAAWQTPFFRVVKWLFKVVILPITTTTIALYGILLYLLKDADRLEAQRGRSMSESEGTFKPEVGDQLALALGSPVHSSDIDFLVSNGSMVLSYCALDHRLIVMGLASSHKLEERGSFALPSTLQGLMTALAISDDGDVWAIGTFTGSIWFCLLGSGIFRQAESTNESPLRHVRICDVDVGEGSSGPTSPTTETSKTNKASSSSAWITSSCLIIGTASNGSVWGLRPKQGSVTVSLLGQAFDVRKSWLFVPRLTISTSVSAPTVFRLLRGSGVEVWRLSSQSNPEQFELLCFIELPLEDGSITAVEMVVMEVRGAKFDIAVVGTSTGNIVTVDLSQGRKVVTLDCLDGPVRKIKSIPLTKPSQEGCILVVSSSTIVKILRLSHADDVVQNSNQNLSALTRSLSTIRISPRLRRVSAIRTVEDASPSAAFAAPRFGIPDAVVVKPLKNTHNSVDLQSDWWNVVPPEAVKESPPTRSTSPVAFLNSPCRSRRPSLHHTSTETTVETIESIPQRVLNLSGEVLGEAIRHDERSSWSILGKSVVGIRRVTNRTSHYSSSLLSGWEVWNVDTTQFEVSVSKNQINCQVTLLESLKPCTPINIDTTKSRPQKTSLLRRRRSNQTLNAVVKVHQHHQQCQFDFLSFSRIQPICESNGRQIMAVGLGNIVAILSSSTSNQITPLTLSTQLPSSSTSTSSSFTSNNSISKFVKQFSTKSEAGTLYPPPPKRIIVEKNVQQSRPTSPVGH